MSEAIFLFLFIGLIGNLTVHGGPYFSLGGDTILDVFILRWIICLARVNFIIIILVTWRTSASWCARGHNKTNIILTIVFFHCVGSFKNVPVPIREAKFQNQLYFASLIFSLFFTVFKIDDTSNEIMRFLRLQNCRAPSICEFQCLIACHLCRHHGRYVAEMILCVAFGCRWFWRRLRCVAACSNYMVFM